MLKITTALVLFLIGIAAQSQVSEDRNISGFSKVEIKNGVTLIYTQSEKESLKAEAENAEGLNNLITEIKGNVLKISYIGNAKPADGKMPKIYISAKNIEAFQAASNAMIRLSRPAIAKDMAIILSSGASFSGNICATGKTILKTDTGTVLNARIETNKLSANFTDNARANLSGTAENAVIIAEGKVFCTARNFVADNVTVFAQENAQVLLYGKANIAVNVADSAKVTYYGVPENIKLSDNSYSITKNIYKDRKRITAK